MKNMGILSLKPSGTSQDLNSRVDSGGRFRLFPKKRDSSDLADDHAWWVYFQIVILSNQCTDEQQ
jgi:hypothetical protein